MMVTYLINTTLCALLLYAVYCLLLEKENMHRFKRMYLLFSLVFSLTIPLVTVNLFVSQLPENVEVFYNNIIIGNNPLLEHDTAVVVGTGRALSLLAPETKSPINYSLIILFIYGLITTAFLFRLLKNAFQIHVCGKNNPSIAYGDAQIVLIKEKLVPHSFGKYIFLNQEDYDNGRIAEEVIIHEWAHIRQKHSWDILFMETLIVFFWFNPICYWYKKKIKLNHEFLADEAVIQTKRTIFNYQMLLINSANQQQSIQLASNFNYLITKKRLIMMTKTTSKTRAWCKKTALIPVFFAAIMVFSTKTMAKDVLPDALPEETAVQDETLLTVEQGVSQELLDEYKAIEGKYYDLKKTPEGVEKIKWKNHSIPENDLNRLYVIYIQMNEEQRNEQYLSLIGPLNPIKHGDSPKRIPREIQWKHIKDRRVETIWLDGKVVEYAALDSYAHEDIYFCSTAFSDDSETWAVLWTEKGYEAYIKRYGKQVPEAKLLQIKPKIFFVTERNRQNNTVTASARG